MSSEAHAFGILHAGIAIDELRYTECKFILNYAFTNNHLPARCISSEIVRRIFNRVSAEANELKFEKVTTLTIVGDIKRGGWAIELPKGFRCIIKNVLSDMVG